MKSALYRKARCLDCDGKHRAGKYLENPKRYIDSNRATRAKLRALMEHHKDLPCVDCHKRYPPWVMDFDHRPGERKIAKVSAFIYFGSETKLLNEIAKCDPVCSNCHRIRTHNRRLKGRNEPRKHGTSRKGCSAARLVR